MEIPSRRSLLWLGIPVLVLLLAGLIAFYFFSRQEDVSALWEQAEQALDRQDLAAASDLLVRYLTVRPNNPRGNFELARTFRREGKFDEARHHLAEARRQGWDASLVQHEDALTRMQKQGVQEMTGRQLLSMVQVPNPDRELLEALYRGDLALHNWDRAGLWLHLWLEKYPDDWPPRLWQAELLERFKKYDQARADYLRVLQQRPNHPQALLGVGLIAVAGRGDYAEAETYLGRYLAEHPGHAEAKLGLARCNYGKGDVAGAREKTLEVLAEHPEHAGAALLLGTIEAEMGHDEEAVRRLRQGESADGLSASYQLAGVLLRLGRSREAEQYRQRYVKLREAQRALEKTLRASEREPNNVQLHYEAGRLNLVLGAEETAVQCFHNALKKDPNHQPSHAALADYYSRQTGPVAATRAELHRRAAASTQPGR